MDAKLSTFMWHVGDGETYECELVEDFRCPMCGKTGAVTSLPPPNPCQASG
jgi:hypothetical protein